MLLSEIYWRRRPARMIGECNNTLCACERVCGVVQDKLQCSARFPLGLPPQASHMAGLCGQGGH